MYLNENIVPFLQLFDYQYFNKLLEIKFWQYI